ncbi:penicillin-binding protein 1C [Ectothiorhodospiraceae bacterium BW-2]|nr:penicillin-binding protein 1C [Ectothiorhodospiraceae bacterium BW-2]
MGVCRVTVRGDWVIVGQTGRDRKGLKGLWSAIVVAGLLLALCCVAWVVLQAALPRPLFEPLEYATELYSREGELLGVRLAADGYWRLQLDLSGVDPQLVHFLTLIEDRRFQTHPGVDLLALLRATGQLLWRGAIHSGGSTLTMQLVRLSDPSPRTLLYKLQQLGAALKLEQRWDKRQILRRYLELAPYGGNLEGVRAATRFYWQQEPQRLTLAQIALLLAIPQAPEARRPDRHPDNALAARDSILQQLLAQGVVSVADYQRAREQPLPLRYRAANSLPYLWSAIPTESRRQITTIEASIQRKLETISSREQQRLDRYSTLAAMVVNNRTREIVAWVGHGDYGDSDRHGYLDLTAAIRSPGSTLKPLFYALAMQQGGLHPQTIVLDQPFASGDYRPKNFTERFYGEVSLSEALRLSLNVPAVKVLHYVGSEPFIEQLKRAGVALQLSQSPPSLAIALGGVGVTLRQLLQLYSALADDGVVRPLQLLSTDGLTAVEPISEPLFTPLASAFVTESLAEAARPIGFSQQPYRLALKTGTSYGFHDAWAVGYNRDYTMAVWVGRADGGFSSPRVGLNDAAPLVWQLFQQLPQVGLPRYRLTEQQQRWLALSAAELPLGLRYFPNDRAQAEGGGMQWQQPPVSRLWRQRWQGEAVRLQFSGGELPVSWFLDQRPVALKQLQRDWLWQPLQSGAYRVQVVDRLGRSLELRVELVEP